jgi:hypothetical protein
MNSINTMRHGGSHDNDDVDAVLWDVTVGGQVNRYRRFGGTSVRFSFTVKMEAVHSSEISVTILTEDLCSISLSGLVL